METVIPFAHQLTQRMRERGPYALGLGQGALGATIHFTAGRWEKGYQSAVNTILDGIKQGYTYLCIAHTGQLLQAHNIFQYGYHAGESGWMLKVGKVFKRFAGVSEELIGIEMCNPGILTKKDGKFLSWFEQEIPASMVRTVRQDEEYVSPSGKTYTWDCPTGSYMKFSIEQEERLEQTLIWLWLNCPAFKLENVLGHHEVSGLHGIGRWRKNDPGGALRMPMAAYRDYLLENKWVLAKKWGFR